MNELALFAGSGGGILGGRLLGWRTVCAVEYDAEQRRVLLQRQSDVILDRFPIWDDVRTFNGVPWEGKIDVISGGFPCTDISFANHSGAGIDGEKSGLWREMARIIDEVRPFFVFVENSPMLVGRGLTRVTSDLAAMGFNARWGVLGANHAGAPTVRERIWIVAYPMRPGQPDGWPCRVRRWISSQSKTKGDLRNRRGSKSPWMWEIEPSVCGVAGRVANRLDERRSARLRGVGNAQVPAVVRMAWRELMPEIYS